MNDIKRNLFRKANDLLGMFPVVAIVGARQVGKTTLAKSLRHEWKYIDLENPDDFNRLKDNPSLFFQQYEQNVIIDEAQIWPGLFPVLRGVVDNNRSAKGRFIITGSSSPELVSQISESLAGRVATVELGTLKTNEYYGKPLSPFYQLFFNSLDTKPLFEFKPGITLKQMRKIWLKGGYPEPLVEGHQPFYDQWMHNYRDTYVNRDVAQLFPRLNKIRYQRFISMLSKLSSTIINKRDLGRSLEFSESTVRDYIAIAAGTFIWRNLHSFEKNIVKSVVKMPKGYIRDTGLLHYIQKITSLEDLMESPMVGGSFESFVIEEILKGLESTMLTNWQPYYYRTRNGAEIDLIIEGSFGILPIEVKYGSSTRLRDLTALAQFIKEHNLPLGIVINQGSEIQWIDNKILQVPLNWV